MGRFRQDFRGAGAVESAEAWEGISAVRWAGGAKHSAGLELKIHAERRSGNCSAPFRWHSPPKSYRWEYSRRKNNLVSLRKSLLRRKQARNSRWGEEALVKRGWNIYEGSGVRAGGGSSLGFGVNEWQEGNLSVLGLKFLLWWPSCRLGWRGEHRGWEG